jgi:hypothetical protein
MSNEMNGAVPNPQILNVDPNVVQTLEMLLSMARRGQIWGLCVATGEGNGMPGRYIAIHERVGPATLFGMGGVCADMMNICLSEANRKLPTVRPSPVLRPNGQAAMVPTNAGG